MSGPVLNPQDALHQFYACTFEPEAFREYQSNPNRALKLKDIKQECREIFISTVTVTNIHGVFERIKQQVFAQELRHASLEEQEEFFQNNKPLFKDLKQQSTHLVLNAIENFKKGEVLHVDLSKIVLNRDLIKKADFFPFEMLKEEFLLQFTVSKLSEFSFSKISEVFPKLTISDIKPNCKAAFLKYLQVTKTKALNNAFREIMPSIDLRNPKPEEKKQHIENNKKSFKQMENRIEEVVKKAVKKFEDGASLTVITNIDLSTLNFDGIEREEGDEKNPVRFHGGVPLLRGKLAAKEFMKTQTAALTAASDDRDKRHKEALEISDYIFFIYAKLKKDLNDPISKEEFDNPILRSEFKQFQEEQKRLAALELQKELNKMIENDARKASAKPVASKSKNRRNKKAAAVASRKVEPGAAIPKKVESSEEKGPKLADQLQVAPVSIIPDHTPFFLDPRVRRWFDASLAKAKKFQDVVMSNVVFPYAGLTKEEINEQIHFHRLPGVEYLMNLSPEDLQRFSSAYRFKHNGTEKQGRCFRAQFKQSEGLIYVGCNGPLIYHAKYVPIKKIVTDVAPPSAQSFCLDLDGADANSSKESWQFPGKFHFKFVNNKIVWKIRDFNQQKVKFKLIPLY